MDFQMSEKMKIKGVQFGNYHSWNDLLLILGSKKIETPKAKTNYIDIPGADGNLDLTEYFGDINYNNRKITFNFTSIIPHKEFLEQYSLIQNLLDGKKVKIILDDDPDFYYYGRLSMSDWEASGAIAEFSIECDCDPFKYRMYRTAVQHSINGTKKIVLQNLRKRVNPTVTTSAPMTIEFNDQVFTANTGTFVFPELFLTAGKNILTITGNGNITFEYQEGGL